MFSTKAFINRVTGIKTGNQQFIPFRTKALYTIVTGTVFGYFYASYFISKNKDFSSSEHLLPYQSEDQVNKLIDETQKPAVIYYYLPYHQYHPFLRRMMLKYSNTNHKDAHFFMVNVRTNFIRVAQSISSKYPQQTMLEVRQPKRDLNVQGEEQIVVNTYMRNFYNMNFDQFGFRSFLQHYGAIKPEDVLSEILNTTDKALFSHQ